MNCDHDPAVGCYTIKNYPVIKVTEYGSVRGDENIMSEILTRGPVSAYINAVRAPHAEVLIEIVICLCIIQMMDG